MAIAVVFCSASPSAGQGLPFHTETALTTAFEQRAVRSFAMWQSRGAVDMIVAPVAILPYAPHERVTTKVVVPLKYARLDLGQGDHLSRTGVADVSVAVKWAFLSRDRPEGTSRLALAGVVSLPTGSTAPSNSDGQPPQALPLGRGAAAAGATVIGTILRGRWGLSADLAHERPWSHGGFRAGFTTRYDLAIGFRLPRHVTTTRTRTLQLYLEWNGSVEGAAMDDGIRVDHTGGHLAFVSPGVQRVVLRRLLLEASLQIPVIQDFRGIQPDVGVRPAFGGRFLFF